MARLPVRTRRTEGVREVAAMERMGRGGEGLQLLTTGEKSSMPEEIAGVEASRRLGEESAAASRVGRRRVSGEQILAGARGRKWVEGGIEGIWPM